MIELTQELGGVVLGLVFVAAGLLLARSSDWARAYLGTDHRVRALAPEIFLVLNGLLMIGYFVPWSEAS